MYVYVYACIDLYFIFMTSIHLLYLVSILVSFLPLVHFLFFYSSFNSCLFYLKIIFHKIFMSHVKLIQFIYIYI